MRMLSATPKILDVRCEIGYFAKFLAKKPPQLLGVRGLLFAGCWRG